MSYDKVGIDQYQALLKEDEALRQAARVKPEPVLDQAANEVIYD